MVKLKPYIVVAALVKRDNKFLLVKEVIEDGKEYWLVPGGKVEYGETLASALKREIKEETNLDIEIKKLAGFQEAIHTNHGYHTVIFFYHAQPKSKKITLEKNIVDAKFFSAKEIKKLNLPDSNEKFLKKAKII
jgi:ADP-ribose pyrophosphatase YjhB (NUDIX family)